VIGERDDEEREEYKIEIHRSGECRYLLWGLFCDRNLEVGGAVGARIQLRQYYEELSRLALLLLNMK
jgi:hypothetical protein